MKPTFLILILFCYLPLCQGQHEIPYGDAQRTDLPEWVQIMYLQNPNPDLVIKEYKKYYKTHPFVKNQHTQYFKRWLRSKSRTMPGAFDHRKYLEAVEETRSINLNSGNWVSIGPKDWDHTAASRSNTPGAAHIYTIEQSVSNPDVLYAGGATCGIWKSIDRGLAWSPITDQLMVNEVFALELSPSDDLVVYAGMMSGLWKTIDGGANWNPTGDASFMATSFSVKDIRMHPMNESTVFFAGKEGLYKTTDAGANWIQILSGNFQEIEFHPTGPDTIYAVRQNIFKTEFFKSIDGGQSFSLKMNGWPAPVQGNNEEQNRTEIAVSIAHPSRVVALAAGEINGGTGLFGVYVSDDAGENWTFQCCGPQPGGIPSVSNKNILGYSQQGTENGGQYYYDLALDISPLDADSIFVGAINLWMSDDGGIVFSCPTNWDQAGSGGYIHADIHDIKIHQQTNEIWIASDGGIFYSSDNGLTFSRRMYGISGTDFHGFDMGFWEGDVMIGGAFHNSTMIKDNQVYINDWLSTDNSGDGLRGFVNFGHDRVVFSDINIKTLPGDRTIEISSDPFLHKPNATNIPGESSKIAFHPWSFQTWYSGEETQLWRTRDHGNTFQLLFDFEENIADIEISWANPNYIFVSTFPGVFSNKKIYRSIDGGYNWTEVTISQAEQQSNFWASFDLTLDGEDPLKLWVARISPVPNFLFDGYLVYQSEDGGNTWSNITSPALDGELPTNIIHQIGTEGGLYLGTRRAVYYRNESMADWQLYNTGLPVSTFSTKLHPYYRKGKIRSATNRSVWESALFESSVPRAMPSADKLEINCFRDTVQMVDHSVLTDNNASWYWEFPNGTPASSTLRNPKVVFHSPGSQTIKLIVSDDFGSDSRIFHDFILVRDACGADTIAGRAMLCTSSPQYTQLPSFNMTLDTFSVSAWVRPDGLQSNFTAILMNDGTSAGIHFREGNNTLGYHWPGGDFEWDSDLVVPINEWSHVCMVVTPSQVTLYVNGDSAVHQVVLSSATLSSLKIGSFKGQASRNFKGVIDEVALWSKALTIDEVRMHRHLTRYIENESGMIAYYQFNQTGAACIDRVNGLNGNLIGASKTISKAPVGGGKSASLVVSSGGPKLFPGTGLTIGFPGAGLFPNGEVVATRINTLPVDLPTDKEGLTNGYWIINNYGSTIISYFDQIQFDHTGFFSETMANANGTAHLYSREEGSDGDWTLRIDQNILIPNSLDATIQYTDPGNMNNMDQWVIVRDPFPLQESEISIAHPMVTSDMIKGGSSVLPALLGNDVCILLPTLSDSQLIQIPSPASGAIAYGSQRKTVVYFDGINWQDIIAIPETIQVTGSAPGPASLIICTDSVSSPNVILHLKGSPGYLLPARMASSSITNISYPLQGMIIFDIDSGQLQCFDGARWTPFKTFSLNEGSNPLPPVSSLPGFALGVDQKDPNAVFEIFSTDQAFMIPSANAENFGAPQEGMLIYDSIKKAFLVFDGINWKRLL